MLPVTRILIAADYVNIKVILLAIAMILICLPMPIVEGLSLFVVSSNAMLGVIFPASNIGFLSAIKRGAMTAPKPVDPFTYKYDWLEWVGAIERACPIL
jgi:hypothetical protein